MYTGHCWRRTAVTLAANNGGTTSDLQALGGWESQRVVNRYIANSDLRRVGTARLVSLATPTLIENQPPTVFYISISLSPTRGGAVNAGVLVPPVALPDQHE